MPDLFDRVSIDDIFSRIELGPDLFDKLDLSPEEKVIFSDEMASLLREELRKELSKLPIGKIIAKVAAKNLDKISESQTRLKSQIDEKVQEAKDSAEESEKRVATLKREFEELAEKMRKKYDAIKTEIANTPKYQFGGFSPQVNPLVIGPDATEGSWRIVKSGDDLSVDRYESGVWVQKGSFNP